VDIIDLKKIFLF